MTAEGTTDAADQLESATGTPNPLRSASSEGPTVREHRRSALRVLSLPLEPEPTVDSLRDGHQRLSQFAAGQQLQVVERPLFSLDSDPARIPREDWCWRALLPIGGKLQADQLPEDMAVARIAGGTYLSTATTQGLPDLTRVYDYLFVHYLPRYKHRLARPCILHRVLDGIESGDPAKLTVALFLPVILSLEYASSAIPSEDPATP